MMSRHILLVRERRKGYDDQISNDIFAGSVDKRPMSEGALTTLVSRGLMCEGGRLSFW